MEASLYTQQLFNKSGQFNTRGDERLCEVENYGGSELALAVHTFNLIGQVWQMSALKLVNHGAILERDMFAKHWG